MPISADPFGVNGRVVSLFVCLFPPPVFLPLDASTGRFVDTRLLPQKCGCSFCPPFRSTLAT